MNTQRQKVLLLLQNAGPDGISSFALTYTHGIKQAPTRIHELQKLGYVIKTSPYKNRSVKYHLVSEPPKPQLEWASYKDKEGRWMARQVPVNNGPKQEGLFQ